jgi:predicted HicB family RNase H-like nuclease
MKIKRKTDDGKKFEYEYKIVYLKEDIHKELKFRASQEKMTINKLVEKLLNQKTCQCPNR